jgi:hypothetical protein
VQELRQIDWLRLHCPLLKAVLQYNFQEGAKIGLADCGNGKSKREKRRVTGAKCMMMAFNVDVAAVNRVLVRF